MAKAASAAAGAAGAAALEAQRLALTKVMEEFQPGYELQQRVGASADAVNRLMEAIRRIP